MSQAPFHFKLQYIFSEQFEGVKWTRGISNHLRDTHLVSREYSPCESDIKSLMTKRYTDTWHFCFLTLFEGMIHTSKKCVHCNKFFKIHESNHFLLMYYHNNCNYANQLENLSRKITNWKCITRLICYQYQNRNVWKKLATDFIFDLKI